jgi:hypothetical protein
MKRGWTGLCRYPPIFHAYGIEENAQCFQTQEGRHVGSKKIGHSLLLFLVVTEADVVCQNEFFRNMLVIYSR